MKTLRICALAAVIIGSSAPLHAEEPFGSIALSRDSLGSFAWGIAWNPESAPEAEAESLVLCETHGGRDCQVVGQSRKACGALAIGKDGGYGTGWGVLRAAAAQEALAECRAESAQCQLELARCSQLQQAGGSGRIQQPVVLAKPAGEDGPAMVLDVICPGRNPFGQPVWFNCWTELANQPGCYFWYLDETRWIGFPTHESASWSGTCRGGVADGEGVLSGASNRDFRWRVAHEGTLSKGKKHGRWVETRTTARGSTREEGHYLDGGRDGEWTVDHWSKCEMINYPVANWMDARDPC
ncbi:MAG: DUF4189 domain-containing protein [Rhodospirillales bacterium]|nr:DUF4189 domain-containing protein [Rhodospirillales bacterium]